MKSLLLFALCALLTASGAFAQTREIYTSPKFGALAKGHKSLAVLPFAVTLQLRPNEVAKNGGPDGVAKLEQREGLDVQSALHSYFLKRKAENDMSVDVQDPARTNALLTQNGVTAINAATFTPEQLAKFLGVDGVISGTFSSTQPLSAGAAVAMSVLVGVSGPTNTGKLMITINDGATGELLWKYDKSLSRGFGSDTNTIVTTIMRKASRQFPYSKEYKG
ncbi:hypothetical protein [Hymenobacter cellulosivorans]|uniref:DUF3313 domain-containing protein n=1 Tax=Hymenobacter cellulosivorans TaxID=2932249 RepID=A0ABY4F8L0_9BACT|nr:hypothetical protein [Hymenobacter cellulosivorans]UOQ52452.1 hypothetical protein MUN80_22210 [Hymenobacter cellulosivorans]